MKRREVQRHVRPEFFDDPFVSASSSASESFSPGISSVVISNQTCVSCLRYTSSVEHRLQVAGADFVVELFGETLEVDVGGVHVGVELGPRLVAHLARGDRNRLDPDRTAGLGHVDRVFHEDDGIVVREGHAATAELSGRSAISSGEAESASVSISRLLLMSQF